MKISKKGLTFIKRWEYFVPYPYDDRVPPRKAGGKLVYPEWKGGPLRGTLTIGYGHTAAAKAGVDMSVGARITEAEAARVLDIDLDPCEAAVNRLVKVPISQGQFDALVSFVFNCGEGAFRKSSILRKLNRGDYVGARAALDLYVKVRNKQSGELETSRGLQNRRDGEQKLWDDASAPLPKQPVDHPAEVEAPKPPKGMAQSTEGWADVCKTAGGTVVAGKEVAQAPAPSPIDKAIEAKQKAEELGVDVNPVSLWDMLGPHLSFAVKQPLFWVGVAVIALGVYGWFRRRQRLYEDLA